MEQDVDHFRGGGSRIWQGLILVAAGILLLAYKMGVPIPHWIFTWPMILIVIGFLSGIKNNFHNPGALILMAVGGVFLIDKAVTYMDFHEYILPALLISFGIIFIMRPRSRWSDSKREWKRKWKRDWRYDHYAGTNAGTDATNNPIPADNSEYLDVNAVFGGVKKIILSKNFKGGEINSFMGGSEINFLQADIQQQVVLDINNVFGGTKLIVPANWDVKNEVTAIFGGVEDKRSLNTATPDPSKTLVIKGNCIFGGIEVANY